MYNEWSEAEKQVMGYKGAEYSSFRLKRDAEKYLKSKNKSKEGEGDHEADQQDMENQRHDENAQNNSQDEIPEVIDTVPLQEKETNYIVMDEYFYSEELEEKLMKNEDDIQNLWEGFDLLWDYVEDGKNRLNQIEFILKSLQGTASLNSPDREVDCVPPTPRSDTFVTTGGDKENKLKDENEALSKKNRNLENEIIEITQTNTRLLNDNKHIQEEMKNIETERNDLKERLIVLEHALSALVKENEDLKENNWQQVTYSRQKEQHRKTSFEANSIMSTCNRFNVLQDEPTNENEVEFPDRERTTFFASQRSRNESEKPSENEVEFSDRERTGISASQRSGNEREKPNLVITGDSIIKNLDPRRMSRSKHVTVKSFPGATVEDMKHYVCSLLINKPEILILHVGTNNIRDDDPKTLVDKICSLKDFIEELSPETRVIVSSLIVRTDFQGAIRKIEEVNHILSRSLRNMINNRNIDRFYLNSSKLHLSKSGDTELAKNFISYMRNL